MYQVVIGSDKGLSAGSLNQSWRAANWYTAKQISKPSKPNINYSTNAETQYPNPRIYWHGSVMEYPMVFSIIKY